MTNAIRARSALLMSLAALGAPWPQAAMASDDRLTIASPSGSHTFSLEQLKQKLKGVTVTVDDPYYKRKVTFDGFALTEVLKLAGPVGADVDGLFFTCKDGYTPGTDIAETKKHEAYLVYGEHGKKKRFQPLEQGKVLLDPAPFYVVWTDTKLGDEYPRPYQVVRIELLSTATKYPKLYPQGAEAGSKAVAGYRRFRELCLRCHSVNLEGGAIGPELNIPQNVTEYWDHDRLQRLILKTSAFRARSKMPDFEGELSGDDLAAIFAYLEFMKDRKVSVTP